MHRYRDTEIHRYIDTENMLVTYRGGMGEGAQKIHTFIYKINTKDAMYIRVTS